MQNEGVAMNKPIKRRHFLKGSITAATMTSLGWASQIQARDKVRRANERINLAWIGCGGRGFHLYSLLRKMPDVAVVAACDVYAPHAQRAQRWIGSGCTTYKDFRHALDRRDVDAVLVTTPDHWHATATVLACRAGKDVYVEKPLGHNIKEGRAMVRAARRHKRIVQAGTQQRSAPHFSEVREILRNHELGEVRFIRIWNFVNSYPEGIGHAPDETPPDGLDWDFYLGPAPARPFNRKRFQWSFRHFWDYAGGAATDLGTHRFDILHYIMGEEFPTSVAAVGGRLALKDDGETPDTIQATFEYPGFLLSYEGSYITGVGTGARTRGRCYYRAQSPIACPFGMAFHGSNGTLFADRLGYEVFPELKPGRLAAGNARAAPDLYRTKARAGESLPQTSEEAHLRNFLECVRSRKKPIADVESGHRSTNVAHLANIALRTGRKLLWDAETEHFINDTEADLLLSRTPRKPWDLI
jgi:predicted dehydrogenase